MLEIELKYPVKDFEPVRSKLAQWKARGEPVIEEADHYHNAPDRDFAKTDEALRMRCIGDVNLITYKGPREGGRSNPGAKTRTEIEVPLGSGPDIAQDFCRLLKHLGYRAVAVVRKQREIHRFSRGGFALQVCLDSVKNVGQFVEIEIVALEENKAAAQEVLTQVARELGLENAE